MIVIFAALVFVMPRAPKFNYDYKKGSVWVYDDLKAECDFPILKSETEYQEDIERASESKVPYFRQEMQVANAAFRTLSAMDMGEYSSLRPIISSAVAQIYSKGVLPSLDNDSEIRIQMLDGALYVQRGTRATKVPASEVYTSQTASQFIRDALIAEGVEGEVDSLYVTLGLSEIIVPDLIYDQQMTNALSEEEVYKVSRTKNIKQEGELIVSKGELVTDELALILDSYKKEWYQSVGYSGHVAFLWLGNSLISLLFIVILFFAIYFANYKIFEEYNKYLYILLIFAISAISTCLLVDSDTALSMFYAVPYTLVAFYLLAFFTKRLVFTIYVVSLLPILVVVPDGIEVFLLFLISGTAAIYVFDYTYKGWRQFVISFMVFLIMCVGWFAFRLMESYNLDTMSTIRTVICMAIGAFLPVAGYTLVAIFEKMFRLVSTSRLVELSDTSNKLLRLLADKAPGTFQHSLQVMNLADATARSIDAYVPLVRAAALYHDIGKINNPQCFTENETPGIKYHEMLSPKESAVEIIRHVSDGLALAEKYGLPGVIKEFISSHHGTTNVAYFLNKYLNDGGNPDDVAEFQYNGMNPKSKEQVILMLCDAIEAASRSMKDYSVENISKLVDGIIDGKVDAGQLSDSDITISELNVIRRVIKSYLQQMYHSRVAYPKREAK